MPAHEENRVETQTYVAKILFPIPERLARFCLLA